MELDTDKIGCCPCCNIAMISVKVGATNLQQCPQCKGVWLDKQIFQDLSNNKQRQAEILTGQPILSIDPNISDLRQLVCPICQANMSVTKLQVNYGKVMIDVCAKDGIWFDQGELRQSMQLIANDAAKLQLITNVNPIPNNNLAASQLATGLVAASVVNNNSGGIGVGDVVGTVVDVASVAVDVVDVAEFGLSVGGALLEGLGSLLDW